MQHPDARAQDLSTQCLLYFGSTSAAEGRELNAAEQDTESPEEISLRADQMAGSTQGWQRDAAGVG